MQTKTAAAPKTSKRTLTISGLYVYPVKGCAGHSLKSADVTRRGLKDDRLYLIVDAENKFVTQKDFPKMSLIQPGISRAGLTLSAPGSVLIDVPRLKQAQASVQIWNDTCEAFDQGDEVAAWLTDFLGKPCRLFRKSDEHPRLCDQKYARPDDEVSFADAFPLMAINDASLRDLNTRLETAVPMNRFRPSLTIASSLPYEEDRWLSLTSNDVSMQVVKNCARSVDVDQKTGQKGKEPLKTLSTYRTVEGNRVIFGQNLVPRRLGTLFVGDRISISYLEE